MINQLQNTLVGQTMLLLAQAQIENKHEAIENGAPEYTIALIDMLTDEALTRAKSSGMDFTRALTPYESRRFN